MTDEIPPTPGTGATAPKPRDAEAGPLVLVVDDDDDVRSSLRRVLEREGLQVRTAGDGSRALAMLETLRPDVVLLDVIMPGLDGYQICSRIQEREALQSVPVIFVTVLEDPEDKARAFAAGAADFVSKPFDLEELVAKIRQRVETGRSWDGLEPASDAKDRLHPSSFVAFKAHLQAEVAVPGEVAEAFDSLPPGSVHDLARLLGVSSRELAGHMAAFLDVPLVTGIDPTDLVVGVLPAAFCRSNLIVPVRGEEQKLAAVVANPFDWELLENVRRELWPDGSPEVRVAEPGLIRSFFADRATEEVEGEREGLGQATGVDTDVDPGEGRGREVMVLANEILRLAVSDRASDIHIEPKQNHALVRFRVDGDLQDVRQISRDQGSRLVSRFKALGDLDIAERRKPQDGAMEATVHGRRFKLRLATTATPQGESLVIRIIEPSARPRTLRELGMTSHQAERLRSLAARSHGLILVVGPTGSGKSTTIFSLLSGIDTSRRSLVTVEDPVEYRIPLANQQQVNEKAGITFESLLRSAVRQDPDVLLLGEIRDLYSAKAALDFSSSGHLCVTTLHSSNATTAVFRLERLGIERGAMADALLGIVAQQLLRKLCDRCKRVRPVSEPERELLEPFTDEVPEKVGEPVGCPRCRETGHYGREGVYELLEVDPELARLIRSGAAIADMRAFVQDRGEFLISSHAVEKVRELTCSVKEVHERVLVEERRRAPAEPAARSTTTTAGEEAAEQTAEGDEARKEEEDGAAEGPATILVVDDDAEQRMLLQRLLEGSGYDVVLADDGTEALLQLGSGRFDMVLSDINMPNLDGLKLLEVMSQKGVEVPVVFLTARTEEEIEVKGLELGAADYLRKPVKKDLLRLRVARALERD